MNCDRCPHMKRIRAALAPCQQCDAGRLHGQVSADASPVAERAYNHRHPTDHTPTEGVTTLSPDVENELRIKLASLFQLSPIQLLLVRHIVNGGSYSSFRKDLRGLVHRVIDRDYDLSDDSQNFKSLAQYWGSVLGRRFAAFAAIAPKKIKGAKLST